MSTALIGQAAPRDIWTIAVTLIGEHGLRAPAIAERRAADAGAAGEAQLSRTWSAVGAAAEALLKPEPEHGERVN